MHVFLIGAIATLLVGCHTNRLAQYPIIGSTALFQVQVSPRAFGAEVWIAPLPEDTARPREAKWMLEIARTAGEFLTEAAAYQKLQQAIVPEELALSAGRGFQKAAEDYLRLRPVRSREDNPAFLVETILEEFTLASSSFGVSAQVRVRSRIIHRETARIVWEDSEHTSIPLQRTTAAAFVPGVATVASILNAGRLLSLEAEEIRRILAQAAQRAGEELGESLRKDVEKLPRKGA
ncbi:MAG: hypothetical protein ABDH31_01510 [Chlorobiota bacterium]